MLYFQTWKVVLILAVCAFGLLFAIPNLFSEATVAAWPSFLPKKQVNLGLDLRGGSYLLMRVDDASVEHERLNGLVDELRTALIGAKIGYTGLGVSGDHAAVTLRDPKRLADIQAAKAHEQGTEAVFVVRDGVVERRTAVGRWRGVEVVLRRNACDVGLEDPAIAARDPDVGPRLVAPGAEGPEKHARNEVLIAPRHLPRTP